MNRNLPVPIDEDYRETRFIKLIRILVQYIILRLVARYAEQVVSSGARALSRLIFPGKERKKKLKGRDK